MLDAQEGKQMDLLILEMHLAFAKTVQHGEDTASEAADKTADRPNLEIFRNAF